jgi:hypothetical protein
MGITTAQHKRSDANAVFVNQAVLRERSKVAASVCGLPLLHLSLHPYIIPLSTVLAKTAPVLRPIHHYAGLFPSY